MKWQRAATATAALALVVAACNQAPRSAGDPDNPPGTTARVQDSSGSLVERDSEAQPGALGNVSTRDECLAPSEPPADPVDSEELVYDAHDAREGGAEPPELGEFLAFHTRLPDIDRAVDPARAHLGGMAAQWPASRWLSVASHGFRAWRRLP